MGSNYLLKFGGRSTIVISTAAGATRHRMAVQAPTLQLEFFVAKLSSHHNNFTVYFMLLQFCHFNCATPFSCSIYCSYLALNYLHSNIAVGIYRRF